MMKKVVAAAALTGGLVLAGSGVAAADAGGHAAAVGSPGILSGNAVTVPVHLDVKPCDTTVNVIALLNPTFNGGCVYKKGHHGHGS
ncbi:chaplin [Streptomyces capparidis]